MPQFLPDPLLIYTGFLKYPLELRKKKSVRTEKKFQLVYTEIFFQFKLRTEKKISVRTEKKIKLVYN